MGYALAISPCYGCGKPFGFNPHRVPSIRVQGERRPICQVCVDRVNPKRIAGGLEPIIPHPDAYSEIDEHEL